MNKIKLNLCALGNPKDPKTWSGTPFRIVSELRKLGQCGEVFDARPPKLIRYALSVGSIPWYGRKDASRAPLRRYVNALKVARRAEKAESGHTLHTSTLTLPFPLKLRSAQSQYLYCDSTWQLWLESSTDRALYTDKRACKYQQLEKKAYSQIRHFFPISEYVKESLISHYGISGKRITVVGTGLGIIQPYNGEKDYSIPRMLFVAKERFKDKGGDLVVEAFQKARKSNPDIQLTMVGHEEAQKYKDIPGIQVLGFIPLEELQRLFETHTMFILPAVNEPWGLVYLEALACKMPIVGLKRNSFPELSGNGKYGMMIDEPDSCLIADTLLEAFKHPQLLKEKGEAGQRFCLDNFSWEKTTQRIIKEIEDKYE